jgi:predicted outer membrane protein
VQETFRDATPEEAAARGAKSGQISNLTGLFKPDAVAKPRELKPKEIQMLTDAEQVIATGEQAIRDFTRALELNPTAYSGALATTRKAIASATSSSDPAYLATEEFANLTTQNALNALKTTFGGNPTEGERKILLEVQGSIGLPPAARARILRRALGVAQNVVKRNKAMIPRIQGGYYSTRTDGAQAQPAATGRIIRYDKTGKRI